MKCNKCGAEIPQGEVLCPQCEEPIEKPQFLSEPEVQPSEEADNSFDDADDTAFAEDEEGDPLKPQDTGFVPDETLQEIVDKAMEEQTKASEEPKIEEPEVEAEKAPQKSHKTTWLIAALLICGAIAAGAFFLQKEKSPQQNAGSSDSSQTVASYTTNRTIHTMLPHSDIALPLFYNAAYSINDYSAIAPMIKSDSIYVGTDNYAKIDGETLYVHTQIDGIDPMSQYPNSMNTLYSLKNGAKEPAVIDTDVQAIQCSSNHEVYYSKYEDDKIVQYRYSNGAKVPVTDFIETDMALVTDCSEDGLVFGFLGLVKGEADPSKLMMENGNDFVPKNGYSVNGTVHFYEKPTSNTHGISNDGKKIYVTDVPQNSRTAHLMVVSDVNTGELKSIAQEVSEAILYSDSGSALCVGNVTLSENVMNPVGDLIYYNGADDTIHTIASDATCFIESVPKEYAWFNENSNEMIATELTKMISIPKAVKEGEFHYINKDGSLCAVDTEGNVFVIQEGFYEPELYSYKEGLMYPTQKGDSFYWAKDDKVYRYVIGSRVQTQSISLDAPINEKIDQISQMGYLLDGTGAVLEQTENTLNRKGFDGSSSCIYDSPNPITVVGLNPAGDKVYFISSDNSLYEKQIQSNSNPKKLSDNVQKAVSVSDGLYVLSNYGQSGGTLSFIAHGQTTPKTIAENVITLSDTVIQ